MNEEYDNKTEELEEPLAPPTRREFVKMIFGAYAAFLPAFLAFAGVILLIFLFVTFVWGV